MTKLFTIDRARGTMVPDGTDRTRERTIGQIATTSQLVAELEHELAFFSIPGRVEPAPSHSRPVADVWCATRAAAAELDEALRAHQADGGKLRGVEWVVDGRLVTVRA